MAARGLDGGDLGRQRRRAGYGCDGNPVVVRAGLTIAAITIVAISSSLGHAIDGFVAR